MGAGNRRKSAQQDQEIPANVVSASYELAQVRNINVNAAQRFGYRTKAIGSV
jgi:hypothetical protein